MPANSTANSASSATPALDDDIQSVDAPPPRAKIDEALTDLRERAGQVAHETLDNLKVRAKPYIGDANQRIADAERYITERVQQQPVSTTLAVLGVGVLIGLVLAGGRRH